MKRQLRQRIKKDELVDAYQHTASWLHGHSAETRRAALIGGAVIVVALGVWMFVSHRQEQAEASLREGLRIFHGTVVGGETTAPEGSGPTFATAEQKYRQAAEALQKTVDDYGSTEEGRRARYYLALSKLQLGEAEPAIAILDELARERGSLQADLARMALAEARLQAQQTDQALELLRQMADERQLSLPREYALMRLGGALERANRAEEAVKSYRRITDEFPTSVYASEARRRLETLGAPVGASAL